MGLNTKEIQLRLCRVVQVSVDSSKTFIQKHPVLSGALLVLFILYVFLSYIYSFLVYLSPFLLATALFVRFFWSSEQAQLKYVRREERGGEQKRTEPKCPKTPKYGSDPVVERKCKYLRQHATSRRRNFKEKKWDVQDGLEERAKAVSTAYNNGDTSTDSKEVKSFEKEESSSEYGMSAENLQNPKRISLSSEPSMSDLVVGYGSDGPNSRFESGNSELENDNMEDGDYEDEEEAQEDRNQVVEWTADDQKNLMDLGVSEIERNRRLESLIARRRARKLLKLQIENGLIDIKNVTPSQIAPLFIERSNPFDSSKDFDDIYGLEMPGSAPSVLRASHNPFDLPYDPSEEKPNLTGDSFDQEFTLAPQKDIPFCRHESFSLSQSSPLENIEDLQELGAREPYPFFTSGRKVSDRLGYPRFRRIPDKGNHDWLIEQMFSKQGGKSGGRFPNSQKTRGERTHQVDTNSKTDMVDKKGDQVENVHEAKSLSDHSSESHLQKNNNYGFDEIDYKIPNVQRSIVSEKSESRLRKPPHEKPLNFPVSNSTNMNESLFDPFPSPSGKNQDHIFFANRRICHTPTCSIASDLQVEVSEIGSPTLTVDETNTTTDGESVVYDDDIEKDFTFRSDDFGGNSFHSVKSHRISEEDFVESEFSQENNVPKDMALQIPLHQKDEENSADVSSISSGLDLREDTPTNAINYDYNIFANVKEAEVEIEALYPFSSSEASSPQKQLKDSSVDHPLSITHEKLEERCNLPENLTNEAQAVNDVNHSNNIEKDEPENLINNEDTGPSTVRQESIDEASVISNSYFSPRSVLPVKALADQVLSSDFDQQIHMDVARSNRENMEQTILNAELPPDLLPQDMQPSLDDQPVESDNGYFSNSQEASYSSNMADDASMTDHLSKPVFDEAEGDQRTSYEASAGIAEASTSDVTASLHSKPLENRNTSNIPENKEVGAPTPLRLHDHQATRVEEPADPSENSIEEENIYSNENDAVFSNKEGEEKIKNNENSEDEPRLQLIQDAAVDSPRLAEIRSPKSMGDKSKGSVDDKVIIGPLNMSEEIDNLTTTEDTKASAPVTEHETTLYQPNPANDVDSDIGAKKNVQGDSANYEEITNLTEPSANTDSINIPSTVEEVLSNTMMPETSSEVAKENEDESHISMGQEATAVPIISGEAMDSSSVNDLEVKYDDLKMDAPMFSSVLAVESDKLSQEAHTQESGELAQLGDVNPSKPDNPHHSSEEVRYLQNESNELSGHDMKKELPLPNVNEATNLRSAEDAEGISDEVNKGEAIEQELNKNDNIVSSILVQKSDRVRDTERMEKLEEVVLVDDVNVQKPGIPYDNSEEVRNGHSESNDLVEDYKEDKLISSNIIKDLPEPVVTEPMTPNKEANEGLVEDS